MQKKKFNTAAIYDVGYGKPPEATQFEKGKSGNPKGRPKGSKNKNPLVKLDQFNLQFSQSMQSFIPANDGTGDQPKTIYLALLDLIKKKALSGDMKALQFLIKTSHQIDYTERLRSEKIVEKMQEYKAIMSIEIELMKKKGFSIDHVLPHPDHIHIDLRTVEVFIRGPSNKKEKQLWDIAHAAIKDLVESIKLSAQKYQDCNSTKEKNKLVDLIKTDLDHIAQIRKFFEGWDIVIPGDEIWSILKSIGIIDFY
ncbi:MAG: DUF5681 domain-containing protein [Hyphomicrobiales bacterium]